MPMILVRVVMKMDEDKVRLHLAYDPFNLLDQALLNRQLRVGIATPKDLLGLQTLGRLFLLAHPPSASRALLPCGQRHHEDPVATAGVPAECPTAPGFAV